MKENEAPEKIYLEWYRIGDKKYRDWCIIPKTNDEPVEYIRKDAFIEKACEWLKENGGSYWMDDYDLPTDELVKDFRNFMEGE